MAEVKKPRAQITISRIIDIESVTRYYKLQSASAAAPSKTTDGAAIPSGWTKTEPAYQNGATNRLYFVDQTIMTNGDTHYSQVSLSSSYEAAKEAWNKANNAQNAAKAAYNKALSVEKSGNELKLFWEKLINVDEADPDNYSKYITFKDGNIIVGISELKRQLVIGSDGIYITNGNSMSLAKSGVVFLGKHTIIGDNSGESSLSVLGDYYRNGYRIGETFYGNSTTAKAIKSGAWSNTNSSVTLPPGVYMMTGTILFAASKGGRLGARFATSDNGFDQTTNVIPGTTTAATGYVQCQWIMSVTEETKYYLQAWQSSGANVNVTVSYMKAVRIA